jgi:hypothetical protein
VFFYLFHFCPYFIRGYFLCYFSYIFESFSILLKMLLKVVFDNTALVKLKISDNFPKN